MRISVAMAKVQITRFGDSTFGSTWRPTMRAVPAPITRAASTYSAWRRRSVWPRVMRA